MSKEKYYLECNFSCSPFKDENIIKIDKKHYCFVNDNKFTNYEFVSGGGGIERGFVEIKKIIKRNEKTGKALIEFYDSRKKKIVRFKVSLDKINTGEDLGI